MTFLMIPEWLLNIPSYFISFPLILFTGWFFVFIKEKFFSYRYLEKTPLEAEAYVRSVASQVVRLGASELDDILEAVLNATMDSDVDETRAKQLLEEEIASLLEEQKSWKELTDVDKLNLAMIDLKSRGYFTEAVGVCCGSCGARDARSAAKQAIKAGQDMSGYVFYTIQDAESAIGGSEFNFWHGRFGRGVTDGDKLKVKSDIFQALKRSGLLPKWNGTLNTELSLDISWQVRWDKARFVD